MYQISTTTGIVGYTAEPTYCYKLSSERYAEITGKPYEPETESEG